MCYLQCSLLQLSNSASLDAHSLAVSLMRQQPKITADLRNMMMLASWPDLEANKIPILLYFHSLQ